MFFFYCCAAHRDLHSFPTRRSSDLRSRSNAQDLHDLVAVELGPQPLQVLLRRELGDPPFQRVVRDRKSTRLNSSHVEISYAVFCLKKKKTKPTKLRTCPHSI